MNETARLYDVQSSLNTLAAALDLWAARDDTRPQPEVRRAANTAMDQIDAMVRELYAMRSRLVTEMRASDDATAARVDAMLARDQAAAQVTEDDFVQDRHAVLPSAAYGRCPTCGAAPGEPCRDEAAAQVTEESDG